MKQDNQAQLTKLLEHHVVQGETIAADDVLGQQTQVDTMSGDTLTVDGTSQVVLLVPVGLTIAQVGDQLVIEREGVAVSTRAIRVQEEVVPEADEQQAQGQQAQGQQQQQTAAQTPTAESSDMPMTEHQQEALASTPEQEQQQTAPEGTAMPSTEHQEEVLTAGEQQAQDQGQEQPGQQQAQGQQQERTEARTPTADESDMPMTEHQQQVLKSEPGQEQQQTAPQGATPMPETEHQRQVLAEGEQPDAAQAPGRGQSEILREATVVGPDIQADNGVIHVIDAVLVPQDVLKTLEGQAQR
jgi:hypothetical protein